jgi:hypothetical protein
MKMNLTNEELTNPFLALETVFANHNVRNFEMLLNEIREKLFEKSYSYSRDSIAHDNIVFFFEQMQKLAYASFLLQQKYTRLPIQSDSGELGWSPN